MKYKIIGETTTQRENPNITKAGGEFRYTELGYTDNHGNKDFNKYINGLFNTKISILDLGCGGGKFIRDAIEDGNFAIGLEGWPKYAEERQFEWGVIPDNLKIINIAKQFSIIDENEESIKFDIITSWEVLEHLFEDEIDIFLQNVFNHSHDNTFIFFTISFRPDVGHFTIKPIEWWFEKFIKNKFSPITLGDYIPKNILIRNCPDSHFLILKKLN